MYGDIAAVSSTSDAAVTLAHEPAPARKRRRPAVVCVQCRRRKVGCDRKKPCAQCIQYKSICTYERGSYEPVVAPTVVKTPADNDSHSTTSSSILQTAALNSTGPSPRRTGTTRISRSASGSASRRSGLVSSPEDVCTPGNAASARIQGKERASRLAIRSSTVQTSVQQYDRENRDKVSGAGHGLSIPAESQSIRNHSSLDPFNGRARFAKSRYFGNSHMGNSMAPFDKIVRSSFHAVYDKGSDANILLEKCKQAARVIKARRPIPQSILMDLRLYVPQRDKCDELVRSYLQTFETVFRVLHTPTFQRQYIRFWEQPEAAEEVFIVKLLLVMSIGSVFRRDLDAVGNFYHFESWSWLYAAQLWLGAPNDKSRLGVDGVQIQCLILLSLQVNGVGADLTCITAGSLVRAAMTIGLHRDPGNFSGMSVMESEVRRRLWATVMEITIQSSLDLGMPPLISQDDFDCEPPRNLDDDQFNETTTTAPIARGLDTFTQSSILCALSRTQSTRLRIVKSLNSVHSDLSYDEAVRWGQELTSACRSNSTLFEYFISSKQPGKGEPSPFQIKLVDVLIRRFILSLHTPFAHRTDVNLAYYFSRKVCVESSLLLLAYSIKSPSTSSRSEEDDYRRLEIFGRGLFKMVFILSAATVIFELTRELQEDSSPSTSTLSRSDLYRSAREIVELSWRRIGAGETSVIGYVYFACALSQIQALQSGNHASTDYSNVAKKTLQECYEILGPAAARHASMDTAESYDWQAGKFPGGEINSAADINPSFQDASLQLDTSTPWTFYGWGTWDTDDMLTSS